MYTFVLWINQFRKKNKKTWKWYIRKCNVRIAFLKYKTTKQYIGKPPTIQRSIKHVLIKIFLFNRIILSSKFWNYRSNQNNCVWHVLYNMLQRKGKGSNLLKVLIGSALILHLSVYVIKPFLVSQKKEVDDVETKSNVGVEDVTSLVARQQGSWLCDWKDHLDWPEDKLDLPWV